MKIVALLAAAVFSVPATAASTPSVSGAQAYEYVHDYASLGIHRTGTDVDDATAAWLASELEGSGLDVTIQPFGFERYSVATADLKVGSLHPEVLPYYYSGSTGPGGVTAELVDVGLGTPLDFQLTDVAGRIVLAHVPMPAPGLIPTFAGVLSSARENGALAVVAAIGAPGNERFGVNVDARHGMCDLPVVIVGKRDGNRLKEAAGRPATLVLDATTVPGTTQNVVATLPGTAGTDDVVIVGTPLNGWYRAATERGTGVGTFLTLARHFAEHRPAQTLVFLGTGGHEVGFLGLERFIEDNQHLVARATSYVHLGASVAARHQVELAGRIVSSPLPDPTRVVITSENPALLAITAASFAGALPFAAVPPAAGQSGEQQFAYEAGVPIVSVSGTFLWFHTARDLPDTTSAEILEPMVNAFRSVVERIATLDRMTVRSLNVVAEQLAPLASAGLGGAVESCP